jgi:hypothetical protein
MAKNQAKSAKGGEPTSETVTIAIDSSHIEAKRDVKFVGKESTYITPRPLTRTEEDRQAAEFAVQDLAEGLNTYFEDLKAAVAEAPEGGEPYRGLLDYSLRHASLFFGRDHAIDDFMQNLERDYLTVLHAASGAGKSSLLKAGIAPRLIAAGHLPICARPNRDPALALKRALLPIVDQIPKLLNTTLRGFFWQVRHSGSLDPATRIYIVLDQFEEFFTQLDRPTQDRFLGELAECLDDGSLKVYWVLSLRKEYLSDLADFKSHINNPLGNEYRLNFLTQDETREVITQPAARRGVKFTSELIEKLLDDLAQTGFYPPHVQLVCHTLYGARSKNEATITLDLYQAQGETAGILRDYLDRVLASLPFAERPLARRLLEFLITSENQRIARTVSELTAEFATDERQAETLTGVLTQLVNSHLLRRVEVSEAGSVESAYELAHDYLVEKVNLDPEVRARKAVKEMLAQEVRDYRRHDTLLSRDKLEFIESRLEPTDLHNEAKELMLGSALALNHNIDFWWEETPPETRNGVLAKSLGSKAPATRQRAAALTTAANDPSLGEPLAELMQTDPDLAVRQSAALSLAERNSTRFTAQLEQMRGAASAYPKRAVEAMAYVQDERPELLDLAQLPGSNWLTNWRMRWLRINRNWSRVGFATLYAALGGALGAAVGGLLGAWGLDNHVDLTIYASFMGMFFGGSTGFGYGLAAVMDKHLRPVGYAFSAALFGGIMTLLFCIAIELRGISYLVLEAVLGLVAGGLGGLFVALITRITQLRIEDRGRRQAVRLGLSLIVGILGGLLLVWADRMRLFPPTPDHPAYGFSVGLLTVPGIVVVGLGWWNKR